MIGIDHQKYLPILPIISLILSLMKNPGDFGSVLKNLTDWSGLGKEWGNGDCTPLLMRFVSVKQKQAGAELCQAQLKLCLGLFCFRLNNDSSSLCSVLLYFLFANLPYC